MLEKTLEEIVNISKQLGIDNKNLHFHLLTPECVFNTKKEFALILENSTDNKTLVNYSSTKQEESAKKLLELLHGIKADDVKKFEISKSVSPKVKIMVKRAKELIDEKIPWHHHALFPGCIFNKEKNKWVVMIEDPETREIMENITQGQPNSDLHLIEPLFYHQKI